jgi:peroxiredoxin
MLHRVFSKIATLFVVTAVCWALPAGVPADNTKAGPLKAAPEFTLTDAEGASIKLAGYKGKVVLLNFWATWCHGCQQEIPWFVQFESKYRERGLAVIGVSMDDDGWKSVRPFLNERKLNYTVVIGNEPLGKAYGLNSMPMTLLINREGKIAASYSGVVDREKCESKIRDLLGSDGKSAAQ